MSQHVVISNSNNSPMPRMAEKNSLKEEVLPGQRKNQDYNDLFLPNGNFLRTVKCIHGLAFLGTPVSPLHPRRQYQEQLPDKTEKGSSSSCIIMPLNNDHQQDLQQQTAAKNSATKQHRPKRSKMTASTAAASSTTTTTSTMEIAESSSSSSSSSSLLPLSNAFSSIPLAWEMEEDDDDDGDHWNSRRTWPSPVRRQRMKMMHPNHNAPAAATATVTIQDLSVDVFLQIVSFLKVDTGIRSLLQVNRSIRTLLLTSVEAEQVLWRSILRQQFPHISTTATATSNDAVYCHPSPAKHDFIDDLHISAKALFHYTTTTNTTESKEDRRLLHWPVLLRLAASQQPTMIDDSFFNGTRNAAANAEQNPRPPPYVRWSQRRHERPSNLNLPAPLNLPPRWRENQRRSQRLRTGDQQGDAPHVAMTMPSNQLRQVTVKVGLGGHTVKAVQYTGPIGQGNRCIRADAPLTKPVVQQETTAKRIVWNDLLQHPEHYQQYLSFPTSATRLLLQRQHNAATSATPAVAQLLRHLLEQSPMAALSTLRSSYTASNSCSSSSCRPFVSPWIDSTGTWNLTPRLVSYFEVTIHPESAVATAAIHQASAGSSNPTNTTMTTIPCIAIGIATADFPLDSAMPGWNAHSFGYHSDDGGIFHAAGHMRKQYGPTFGAGDTIGCGIDYVAQKLFFTKNGQFLGYALLDDEDDEQQQYQQSVHSWTGTEFQKKEWYPVIGLDANTPVTCQFVGPFQFDLKEYLLQTPEHVRAVRTMLRLPSARQAATTITTTTN